MGLRRKCHNLETVPRLHFSSEVVIPITHLMALGGKHSLPGFEQSLQDLRADILMMAALVRRSLNKAKTDFVQRDEDDCSAVIADDDEVDLLVKQVDRGGTNILIRFQPLASDFRTVLATIKLGSHLENISDQAVSIARRARALIQESGLEADDGLTSIFELVDASLSEALEAFSAFDNTRAEKLRRQMEPLAQSARDLLEKFSELPFPQRDIHVRTGSLVVRRTGSETRDDDDQRSTSAREVCTSPGETGHQSKERSG
jgi:phosphate transport system protein